MIISLGNEICNKVNTRLEEIQTREFAILSLRFLYKEKKKGFWFFKYFGGWYEKTSALSKRIYGVKKKYFFKMAYFPYGLERDEG